MSENLNKLFSPINVVEDIIANKTLDLYDTGKIFFAAPTDPTANLIVQLPDPAGSDMTGWHTTFIIKSGSAPTTNDFTIGVESFGVNAFRGSIRSSDGGIPISGSHISGSSATDADQVRFNGGSHASTPATAGDRIDLVCDGAGLYYVNAICAGSASVLFVDL